MGFHASGDMHTRQFEDMTKNIPWKTRSIDDSILWDSSIKTDFWQALDYIQHCRRNEIMFNTKKFAFRRDEVDFA